MARPDITYAVSNLSRSLNSPTPQPPLVLPPLPTAKRRPTVAALLPTLNSIPCPGARAYRKIATHRRPYEDAPPTEEGGEEEDGGYATREGNIYIAEAMGKGQQGNDVTTRLISQSG